MTHTSKARSASIAAFLMALGAAVNAAQTSADGGLPSDVRRLLDRASLCDHLAGEYDGVGSVRNAEVSEAVRKNRCDFVAQELARIKRKYASHSAVVQKISERESEASN